MMEMIQQHSIRNKLLKLLILISGTTLIMATLGIALNDWVYSREDTFSQLNSQAGIIGNNSIGALTFKDIDSANNTLDSLAGEKEIVVAALFDDSEAFFASYLKPGHTLPAMIPELGEGDVGDNIYVHLPIYLDGETIGTILILYEYRYWDRKQLTRLATFVGLFLASLILAMALSTRLQSSVTSPIIKLSETAREITQSRNYNLRAKRLSADEIGLLVDDFNEMLNQIQSRDNELKKVQEGLEAKVQERTSELSELAGRLRHQAYHDSLTGLTNRITFDNNLSAAIDHTRRIGGEIAVLFLDLDRFKIINDTLGHAIGDKLLIEVSERLAACTRRSDTLSRLGGDEFAVLILDATPENAMEVAVKLTEAIAQSITIEGHLLHVTTSIGISLCPSDGTTAQTILKNADGAMYRSKERGRNQSTFFTPEMNDKVERRLSLEIKLREAISRGSFQLNYQPLRNTETLELVGVETLLRWNDKELGAISPLEFIPLAEECGLGSKLDNWVLENACREMLLLFEDREINIQLSVNFSPSHFLRREAEHEIARILQNTGFPGNRLQIEITENVVGQDTADIQRQLEALKELGVEIAIDDFGTEYSSLSRLKKLPIDTLKIDRSFIADLGKGSGDEVLVRTIVSMGQNLNLKVVAEGIETKAQHQFVQQCGCTIVQGFLFGKPAPLKETAKLIDSRIFDLERDA